MFNPDEDVLQEIQSSDSDEEAASRSKAQELRELVHEEISHLHDIYSDDEVDDITSPIGSPPAEISALGGRDKFLQLRKKLEEDQAKTYESIQPIQVTDVETLLETFRSERDQSRSSTSKIEANPKFLELYQQVKDRDHRIIDLETKLMEQNRRLVDLEDTLSEKEKLVTSKNEAVSVVHQKYEGELRLKKEELEKSQRLLFDMEKNLGKIQDQWKEDKDRFNTALQKQEEKYHKLEESSKSLESTRFQLTTQVAELQEQLVLLQTERDAVVKEKSALQVTSCEQLEKFTNDVEEFEKLKEQHQINHDLVEREREMLSQGLHDFEASKTAFASEVEEFQNQKSIFHEESQALAEEKIAVSREREAIDAEKEAFYSEKQAFDLEKDSLILSSKQELEEKNSKIQELSSTLEKYQTNIKKLKAQFQAKLKALKEEQKEKMEVTPDSRTQELEEKVAEMECKLNEYQNKITELEEEKDLKQWKDALTAKESEIVQIQELLHAAQEQLEVDRATVLTDRQILEEGKNTLCQERTDFETLKEKLSHEQESLCKAQEVLRLDQETLFKDQDVLSQERSALWDEQEQLEKNKTAVAQERESLAIERFAFFNERDNENVALNFEREALRSQREALEGDQEAFRKQQEELHRDQEALTSEKETLRTDKQGLAMERETWQSEQEAQELQLSIVASTLAEGEPVSSARELELTAEITALNLKVKELTELVETSRNNVKKLKLQYQAKLKMIKEKSATADARASPDSDKLQELQNKVAELEEEKGQLLLRLVDFEELQATRESMLDQIRALESRSQVNEEIISTLKLQKVETLSEVPLFSSEPQSLVEADSSSLQNQVRCLTQQVEILEQSLQQKASKIQTLESEIISLQEQIEFNREDFTSAVADFDRAISKKNEEYKQQQESYEMKLQAKETQLQEKETNLQWKESQLQEKVNELKQLQCNFTFQGEQVADLQDQRHTLEGQVTCLEAQQPCMTEAELQREREIEIFRLTGENADLYRQLEEVNNDLKEKEKEINTLQSRVESLSEDNHTNVAEENPESLTEVMETKQKLEQALELSNIEIQRLQDLNAELDEKLLELSQALDESKVTFQKLQDMSNNEQSKLSNFQEQVESLHEEITHFKSREDTLKTEVQTLKEQLLEKDEEFETAGTELEQLRTKVEALEREMESERSALEPLQLEISQLKTTILDKDEELEFTNDQIMTLSGKMAQVDKLEKALTESLETIARKDKEIQAISAELTLLNQFSQEKESNIEDFTQRIQQLENSLMQAQGQIGTVEGEKSQLQETNDILKKEVQALRNELKNIQIAGDDLHKEIQRVALASQVEVQKHQDVSLELQSRVLDLTSTLEHIKSDLQQSEQSLQEQQNLHQEVLLRKNALLEENSTKETFILNLTQQNEALLSRVSQLEQESQSQIAAHVVEEKDREMNRLRTQLEDLEQILESANAELKNKQVEIDFTKEEMSKLTEALNHVEKVVLKEVQDKEESMKVQVLELTTLVSDKDQEIKKIMSDYDEYYNQARFELDAKTKSLESLEQTLFEKHEVLAKLEETVKELKERHQAEIFEAIEKHNDEEETLFARISSLSQENDGLKITISRLESGMGSLTMPVEEPMIHSSDKHMTAFASPATHELARSSPFGQSQHHSGGDFFDSFTPVSLAEETPVAPATVPTGDTITQQQHDAEIADKERQIYEQSVQITELEISLEDLRSQLMELTELKMQLDMSEHQKNELKTEIHSLQNQVRSLQNQLESMQNERIRKMEQFVDQETSGTKSTPTPVVEETLVRATAYTTTEGQPDSTNPLVQEKDAQINSLSTELRELKVKSGKLLQKLRQTTKNYEELHKAYAVLKDKSEFSLESALEGEISEQLKKKDDVIAEKTKLIQEIQTERMRLQNQIDVFERANEKLTEGKELQDRALESLVLQKKSLEQEIQGLKWKLEEVEAMENAPFRAELSCAPPIEGTSDFALENSSLRIQNTALVQEIETLQQEVNNQRAVVAHLQLQLEQLSLQAAAPPLQQSAQGQGLQQLQTSTPAEIQQAMSNQQLTNEEILERAILERKIELLQNKISELEINETRYYDDLQKTKAHAQMLDMENLMNQEIISDLNRRLNSTEKDNLKTKILQEEVNRLILILDEKDNSKCEQITSEIIKLQEEKAALEYQLASSCHFQQQLQQHQQLLATPIATDDHFNIIITSLREQLGELERRNLLLEIDFRRENNARRIVQEQLFFKQASKSQNHRLGPLVGNTLSTSSLSSSPRSSPLPPTSSPGFGALFATPPRRSSPRTVTPPEMSPKLPL